MAKTLQERFDAKWEIDLAGCWIWTASVGNAGFGQLLAFGKNEGANRVSWMLHHGEIPDGMHVLQRCRVRRCVNPEHLVLGHRLNEKPVADPLRKRFAEKWTPEPNTGCHLWTGSLEGGGYGNIRDGDRSRKAHRVSWELVVGPIPDGLQVLHRCDVRSCVNPDHLFLGTHQDNMADMAKKGRARHGDNRGERCVTSKLKDDDIRFIRASRGRLTGKVLSEMFHCSRSNISMIQNRTNWGHLQ